MLPFKCILTKPSRCAAQRQVSQISKYISELLIFKVFEIKLAENVDYVYPNEFPASTFRKLVFPEKVSPPNIILKGLSLLLYKQLSLLLL